ncbi:MAG: PrsW family glutamic-type intramembrane protease [Candidatus Bathyarchaeota archaeon]|nr:PrsW family glutamic-type intramembrane protease [Candidatus Bathyarchaeota archaeon]
MEHSDDYCAYCGLNLEEWKKREGFKEPTPDAVLGVWKMTLEAFGSVIRPQPLNIVPSAGVFQVRQPASLLPFLGWAIALLAGGLVLSYGGDWYTYLGLTVAGYAAPLVFLIWIFRSDRYEREPIALVAYCFGWGAFSGIAAGVLNTLITGPLLGVGGAGIIEEPLKALGIYLIAKNTRVKEEFNDHLDGMIYGAAAGAGFAGLENFWYISEMVLNLNYPPFTAIIVRSLTAFMHIAWSAIVGRSLGLAKAIKGEITFVDLVPGVIVAALLHMVWNLSPPFIAFAVIFPTVAMTIRQQIKAALRDEERWGFTQFAPDENNEVKDTAN